MEPIPPAAPSVSYFTTYEMGSVQQQQDCCSVVFLVLRFPRCTVEQMYKYSTSSSYQLPPRSLECLLVPNHPVRVTKQPLRPYIDSQTSPSLQRAWPECRWKRNWKDVLSTWWADSEKWLELLSFSLWHSCDRAVLSSRVLQKPKKMVFKSISREILLCTHFLSSFSPFLLPYRGSLWSGVHDIPCTAIKSWE